jgi:hypothetical protein
LQQCAFAKPHTVGSRTELVTEVIEFEPCAFHFLHRHQGSKNRVQGTVIYNSAFGHTVVSDYCLPCFGTSITLWEQSQIENDGRPKDIYIYIYQGCTRSVGSLSQITGTPVRSVRYRSK